MVREEIVLGHDKCLYMRTYVDHRRVDTQQAQEPIGAAKCEESCSCPWQPRPQEGYVDIQTAESRMGLTHTSVNRTDTQTSKVLTMQMMMTLILTATLCVKTNTD